MRCFFAVAVILMGVDSGGSTTALTWDCPGTTVYGSDTGSSHIKEILLVSDIDECEDYFMGYNVLPEPTALAYYPTTQVCHFFSSAASPIDLRASLIDTHVRVYHNAPTNNYYICKNYPTADILPTWNCPNTMVANGNKLTGYMVGNGMTECVEKLRLKHLEAKLTWGTARARVPVAVAHYSKDQQCRFYSNESYATRTDDGGITPFELLNNPSDVRIYYGAETSSPDLCTGDSTNFHPTPNPTLAPTSNHLTWDCPGHGIFFHGEHVVAMYNEDNFDIKSAEECEAAFFWYHDNFYPNLVAFEYVVNNCLGYRPPIEIRQTSSTLHNSLRIFYGTTPMGSTAHCTYHSNLPQPPPVQPPTLQPTSPTPPPVSPPSTLNPTGAPTSSVVLTHDCLGSGINEPAEWTIIGTGFSMETCEAQFLAEAFSTKTWYVAFSFHKDTTQCKFYRIDVGPPLTLYQNPAMHVKIYKGIDPTNPQACKDFTPASTVAATDPTTTTTEPVPTFAFPESILHEKVVVCNNVISQNWEKTDTAYVATALECTGEVAPNGVSYAMFRGTDATEQSNHDQNPFACEYATDVSLQKGVTSNLLELSNNYNLIVWGHIMTDALQYTKLSSNGTAVLDLPNMCIQNLYHSTGSGASDTKKKGWSEAVVATLIVGCAAALLAGSMCLVNHRHRTTRAKDADYKQNLMAKPI